MHVYLYLSFYLHSLYIFLRSTFIHLSYLYLSIAGLNWQCKLSIYSSIYSSVYLSIYLSIYLSRIGNIVGLEALTELKVLNLAGNLIRKISGLTALKCIEELNLRSVREGPTPLPPSQRGPLTPPSQSEGALVHSLLVREGPRPLPRSQRSP